MAKITIFPDEPRHNLECRINFTELEKFVGEELTFELDGQPIGSVKVDPFGQAQWITYLPAGKHKVSTKKPSASKTFEVV